MEAGLLDGQHDVFQTRAVAECAGVDGNNIVGNDQDLNPGAVGKPAGADDSAIKGDVLKCAASAEGIVALIDDVCRNMNEAEPGTACKSVVSDRLQPCGQVIRPRVAAIERIMADPFERRGEDDSLELSFSFMIVGIIGDLSDSLVIFNFSNAFSADILQRSAVIIAVRRKVASFRHYAVVLNGIVNAFHIVAAVEDSKLGLFNGQGDLLQSRTAFKRRADADDRIGDHQRFQAGSVFKAVVGNIEQVFGGEAGDAASVETLGAYGVHLFRHADIAVLELIALIAVVFMVDPEHIDRNLVRVKDACKQVAVRGFHLGEEQTAEGGYIHCLLVGVSH